MPKGGAIILGLDEADGRFEVVGVRDPAATQAGLVSQAREAVRPSPHLEFQSLTVDGRLVQIAHVSPLRTADKPADVGGRAFLRQADGDSVMRPHELRMIGVAKLHLDEQIDYDLAPARGRSITDLSPELTEAYPAGESQNVVALPHQR